MRKFLVPLLFSIFVSLAVAQETVDIKLIVEPSSRLTTHWCFVVDNSHSMRGVFGRVRAAFQEATSMPSDQLDFSIVTFNNQNMERFLNWTWASDEAFEEANRWINENPHGGVLSYGATAISMALQQEVDELTIILITDGGFTEVSRAGGDWNVMRRIFQEGQDWRKRQGYGDALVTCLGISNPNYTAGNKPSDEECQRFLQEIGTQYNGGYWLVGSQ